jgi:hypothetical protein
MNKFLRAKAVKGFWSTLALASSIFITAISATPAKANEKNKTQDYYNSNYYNSRPIKMGITFSPNLSWLRYGDEGGYDGKSGLGYAYGLLTDFGISENYFFSTGLLINTLVNQTTYNDTDLNTMVNAKYRLQYVEIPLAVKLKSIQQYNRSYYGKFGFTAGVKVNGKERINDASSRTKIDGANIFRLGLQIGGGVEWQLDHNLNLMTGLTFNNGFTRAVKTGEPKTSYLSLDFGIFF